MSGLAGPLSFWLSVCLLTWTSFLALQCMSPPLHIGCHCYLTSLLWTTMYGGFGPRWPPDCRSSSGPTICLLCSPPPLTSACLLFCLLCASCTAHVYCHKVMPISVGAMPISSRDNLIVCQVVLEACDCMRRVAAALCIFRCPTKTGCIGCVTYLQGDTCFTRGDAFSSRGNLIMHQVVF